jgi:hypothetical protein
MDKDMRLRARAIRNLKEDEEDYDEDDILAEMDRLLEEEEREEEKKKERNREEEKDKLLSPKHQTRYREDQESKLLRLTAIQKLRSRGVPYDDTDLEIELDRQSRLCEEAKDNLNMSTTFDIHDDTTHYWNKDRLRAEMERLEAEEEERSRASASSAAAEPSKLRIQALRNLKALGDPFDEYDIEIEIANILESRSSTPSKSARGKRK